MRKACLFIFTIVVVVVVIVVVTSSAVRPGVERQGGSMANNYTFLNNLFFFVMRFSFCGVEIWDLFRFLKQDKVLIMKCQLTSLVQTEL